MTTEEMPLFAASGKATLALLLALGGTVGAVVSSAATAAVPPDTAPHISVKFDRKLLNTEAGAQTVYRRLREAAADVCPDVSGSHLTGAAALECRDQAVARAIRQIDSPRLAAVDTIYGRKG